MASPPSGHRSVPYLIGVVGGLEIITGSRVDAQLANSELRCFDGVADSSLTGVDKQVECVKADSFPSSVAPYSPPLHSEGHRVFDFLPTYLPFHPPALPFSMCCSGQDLNSALRRARPQRFSCCSCSSGTMFCSGKRPVLACGGWIALQAWHQLAAAGSLGFVPFGHLSSQTGQCWPDVPLININLPSRAP